MLVAITNILYAVVLLALYRLSFGSFFRMTLHHVFLISFFILIFVSSYDVYVNWRAGTDYLLGVYFVPVLYLIFATFGRMLFAPRYVRYSGINNLDERLLGFAPVLSLLFVMLVVLYVIDMGVNGIALIYTINNVGDAVGAMELRLSGMDSRLLGEIGARLYGYTRATFAPFYVVLLFVLFRERRVGSVHFYTVFLVASFFMLATTAKAPFAYMLIGMLAAWFWMQERIRKGAILKVAFFLTTVLFVPALLYPVLHGVSGSESIAYAFDMLYRRLFFVPSYTTGLYFNYYGSSLDFVGFSSNQLLAYLFSEPYINIGHQVYSHHFPRALLQGSVNSSFFASFYAGWGWTGVILGCAIVGFVVPLVEFSISYFKVGALALGVRAICTLALAQMMMTNFFSVLIGRGFLLLPVLYVIYCILFYREGKGALRRGVA